ncbi:MAG: DUF5752 family protein [Gammaproteobacteria bacterium]
MADKNATFSLKDCALVALGTGKKARLLQEFRNELAEIDPTSIYHHFWGGLLQPRFEEREYNNDFAAWVRHAIHDSVLAERLAVLTPTAYPDIEALRSAILDLIDARLDEVEYLFFVRATQQFEFIRSQIVVFDSHQQFAQPADLAAALPSLSTSSIFYHFIDARRRTPDGQNDFCDWLMAFDDEYTELCAKLSSVDPFFGSLGELRIRLAQIFAAHFKES